MTRVLVADDDPDLVAICALVLESEGFYIDVARNGSEAYEYLRHEKPDLALLDVMMPVLDGITVCKMLKRDAALRDTPVIIMSASERLCEAARGSNADAVISKPFDVDHLIATVQQLAGAP